MERLETERPTTAYENSASATKSMQKASSHRPYLAIRMFDDKPAHIGGRSFKINHRAGSPQSNTGRVNNYDVTLSIITSMKKRLQQSTEESSDTGRYTTTLSHPRIYKEV